MKFRFFPSASFSGSDLPEELSATGFDFKRLFPIVYWIVAAASVGGIVYHVCSLAWWGDDSFFSFAYARNLVRGAGLVYNAGEHVEGYTNFLWTVMIAGGMKAGIDPMVFTKYAGSFFHACTVALFAIVAWRIAPRGKDRTLFLPLTAMALAIHHEFNVYGTSGLETAVFAFGVSLLYVLVAFGRTERMALASGCAALFIMLNRPDAVVFIAPSFVFLYFVRGRRLRPLMLFAAPLILVYVPYWLIRFSYYGMPFPNTFYAKSIADAYPGQGFEYTSIFFRSYCVFLVLPALFAAALTQSAGPVKKLKDMVVGILDPAAPHPLTNALGLALLFIGLQIAFVVYIGGDFMFGRFFIMIIPLMFFAMEIIIIAYANRVAAHLAVLFIIGGTMFRIDVFEGKTFYGMIADEQAYYAKVDYAEAKKMGEKMHEALAGTDVRVAFGGALATFTYFLDPTLGIDATTGLNDSTIAHQHLEKRGRPGHEKRAPLDYLLKRKVQLFFDMGFKYQQGSVNNASIFGIPTILLRYDSEIMNKIGKLPGVYYTPIEPVIDTIIASLPTLTHREIANRYAELKTLYFEENNDPVREQAFLNYLR